MEEINKLITDNNFEVAKLELKKILDQDEKNLEALKLLGLCCINLEQFEEGKNIYETVVKYFPEDASSWFYLAICYDNLEDFLHAKTAYNEVIKLREEYVEAYKNLCIVYVKTKEPKKAIELAKKALAYVEDDYTLYYIIGTAYMSDKNFEDSVQYLEKALKLNPTHAQLYNNLGTSYITIGNLDKAYENYVKASEIEPDNSITYFNIASILQIQNKHKEACEVFRKAYELEPTDSYLVALALSEVKAGEIENAIEHYKFLITQYPEKHNFQYNLVCCYELIEEYQLAINILQNLVVLNPKSVSMSHKLANLYLKIGQPMQAKVIYEKIILQGNVSYDLYYEFAHICVITNDLDKAEKILKKVVELSPEYAQAHKDLGVIYLGKRLFDYAKDEFETAYKLNPNNPSILFEYAGYLHATTDFKGADEMYAKSLELVPNSPNTLALSALNKTHLKEYDLAKEQIDKALKMANDNAFMLFIAGKIRYLLKDFEDAKTYLIRSYESDNTSECANLLALCYLELENYNQALVIFNNLLEKNSMNVNLLLNIAKCYEKMNDIPSALQNLEKAVEIFPDCEEAHELIRKLS